MKAIKLSRIDDHNNRVSCNAFCGSAQYVFKSEEEKKMIEGLPFTDLKNIKDIDNGDIYEWYQIGKSKYGRSMYCPKTNIIRDLTLAEFYGNSTVD